MSEMGWGYGSAGWSPRHLDDNSELQAALRPPPCAGQWAAEDFAVVRRPERRPLLIRATRLAPPRENGPLPGPAWVVKISDPERRRRPDPRVLLALFGLTRAEAGVVLEMLPPRSEEEGARHRGVAKATFRAQLHAAYGKLGVNGRDELVHLLASYGSLKRPQPLARVWVRGSQSMTEI